MIVGTMEACRWVAAHGLSRCLPSTCGLASALMETRGRRLRGLVIASIGHQVVFCRGATEL